MIISPRKLLSLMTVFKMLKIIVDPDVVSLNPPRAFNLALLSLMQLRH